MTKPHRDKFTRAAAISAVALTGLVGGLIGIGLRSYVNGRKPYLAQVSEELRTPALYLPNHLVPPALMLFILGIVSRIDAIRDTDRDVDIQVIEGHNPDDGHPFSARQIVPRRLADAKGNHSELRPAMVWTHGGGHLIGTPGFYDPQNAQIADDLGIKIFAPSYRKANKAPFPADLDDCYAVLRWVQENAKDLGIDPQRIAVCGDSAGGGLAAGVIQRAIDDGNPVAFQGLVYPMLDHRCGLNLDDAVAAESERKPTARGQLIWTAGSNAAAWNLYLGQDHADRELAPYASPLHRADLAGTPPTWIGIGELDLFYDEAEAFARRLDDAGVEVEFRTFRGAYHGFDHLAPRAKASKQLIEELTQALHKHLFAQ